MTGKKKSILVLSGKIFDGPYSLKKLDALREAVDRNAAARGVVVVRRVATLSLDRLIAAPFFLKAGFETIPADDEDAQAIATLCLSLGDSNAPEEAIFSLGAPEPIALTRSLAGRFDRVWLAFDELSAEFESTLDGTLDARLLLSQVGVDPAPNDGATWEELMEDVPTSKLAVAFAETFETSFNAPNDAATVAASDYSDAPSGSNGLADAPNDVESLCRPTADAGPSPLELAAPEWNAALEELLLKNDLKYPAYLATEQIADRFPELPHFFLNERESFLRLLSPRIATIVEDSSTILFHRSHPDLRSVSAAEATNALKIGSAAPSDFGSNVFASSASGGSSDAGSDDYFAVSSDDDRNVWTRSKTFGEIADRAALLAECCRWSSDRQTLIENGADFKESIAPRDQALEEKARELSTFLWPIRRSLRPAEYREAAEAYDAFSAAFAFLEQVVEDKKCGDVRFLARVCQAAADAQCAVKSALIRFGLSLGVDGVQQDAFNLLADFRRRNGAFLLANMRLQDVLPPERSAEILALVADLKEEYADRKARTKERRACEGRVEYHLKKLALDPTSEYDWEKVVEATTTLCETFREPASSLWFRKRLIDWIDKIPESTPTTETFGRVVQEIDLYRIQEEEAFASCLPEEPEIEYSPAVKAVRERYSGSGVVFVGGTPQEHLRTRLEEAFDIRLFWTETSHGDSLERFSSLLRDAETRLFLIYIPWCSHKHSEEFATLAKEAGKDFVRVRKGTNPEQIARAVCQQLNLTPDNWDI